MLVQLQSLKGPISGLSIELNLRCNTNTFLVFKSVGDIPSIQMAGMYIPSWYVPEFDTSKSYIGFVFGGIKGRDGIWRGNDGHSWVPLLKQNESYVLPV